MNLARMLDKREAEHQPVRVAVIGCGKFATMYLTQARTTPGIHIVGIADLDLDRARANLQSAGWPQSQSDAAAVDAAIASGGTCLTEDAVTLIEDERIDVVVEATGLPHAGIRHCQAAIRAGHHVVMVNVEADVVAGPLLAQQANAAGVVYSLAWGINRR